MVVGTEVGAVVIVESVPIVDVSSELVDGLDKGEGGIDGGGKEDTMFLTCPSWGLVTLFAEVEKSRAGTGRNEEQYWELTVAS